MCPPIRDRANSFVATFCGLRKCHSFPTPYPPSVEPSLSMCASIHWSSRSCREAVHRFYCLQGCLPQLRACAMIKGCPRFSIASSLEESSDPDVEVAEQIGNG